MAPNLLRKTSNRYLQLTLPENLIPNKRIGKREKLRTRLPYNAHSRIEKELCREWLFSWNTSLKETKQEKIPLPGTNILPRDQAPQPLQQEALKNLINENTLKLNAPFLFMKWSGFSFPLPLPGASPFPFGTPQGMGLHSTQRKKALPEHTLFPSGRHREWEKAQERVATRSLVTPDILMWKMNRALGGNLFQYLSKYIKSTDCSAFAQGNPGYAFNQKKAKDGAFSYQEELLSDSTLKRAPGLLCNSFPSSFISFACFLSHGHCHCLGRPEGKRGRDEQATPLLHVSRNEKSRAGELGKGGTGEGKNFNSGELTVNRAPFLLGFVDDNYNPLLTGQNRFNNFRFIYSLNERRRGGTKRDKINDDYRNRLAEWRKFAFFYGDLPKRAVARIMRQAGKLRGDRNSNFLSLLETRLDVTLRRAFFFSTIKTARQWIVRGKILVNNKKCLFSGYLLQPGDVVSITECSHHEFRKQCLGTLSVIKNSVTKEHQGSGNFSVSGKRSGLESVPKRMERRFPFSPLLMRKWKEWSQLWSISKQKNSFPFNQFQEQPISYQEQERQKEMSHTPEIFGGVQHFSLSSSFALYSSAMKKETEQKKKEKPFFSASPFLIPYSPSGNREAGEHGNRVATQALCGKTSVTSLLGLLGNGERAGKIPHTTAQQLNFSPFQKVNKMESKREERASVSSSRISTPFRKESFPFLFNAIPEKKNLIQRLYQERSSVIDGCFPLRWNRVFATKKSVSLRKKHWRWSCLKPLHLECCYKHYTLIFLYSPQKLACPGSIDVSLLWKQLGG